MLSHFLPHSAPLMADSLMAHYGLLNDKWSYDYGVVWRGMEVLFSQSGNSKYMDYIHQAMDSLVNEKGEIHGYRFDAFNLDYICNGRQLLSLWKLTGDKKYRIAADTLREQLRQQPRTSDGGFWHKQCYPQQMWLDGLHMAAPFYTEYCLMTADDTGVLDAAQQLTLAWQHTMDKSSGLNRHAWDAAHIQRWADPKSGLSPHAWGRATGWYLLALADVLALIPKGHTSHEKLQNIFTHTAEKLLSIRDGNVWLQVLDCPERAGNYRESSASCLITAAILKMANLGYVPTEMGNEAADSFLAIQREFVGQMQDGRLFLAKCCSGAGLGGNDAHYRDGSYDYYMSEAIVSWDLKGTGAYIQAACEMTKWREEHAK